MLVYSQDKHQIYSSYFSAVSARWNYTFIHSPLLIYMDELPVDNRSNPLITYANLLCRSENQAQVGWHLPGGELVSESGSSTGDFRQTRTDSTATPSQSRLSVNRNDVSRSDSKTNGLWTCRMNGDANVPSPIPVAIYRRGIKGT